jgi:hypothetical protein
MAELSVEEQLAEMTSDWDSPIGVAIAEITDELAATMKATAPVSSRGSKYSPPGAMKSSTHGSRHIGKNSRLYGLASTPRFPGNFILPLLTDTRLIRNQYSLPGTNYGRMPKDNSFFDDAASLFAGSYEIGSGMF